MSLWKSSRLHSRAECRPTPCEYVHVRRFSHGLHTVQEECLLHNKHSRSARPSDRSQTKREDTFFLVVLCNFPLGNFRHDCSTRWERFHIPEYILGKPVKLLLLSCGGWSPALSAHYQHLVSQLEEQRPLSLCIICVCVCVCVWGRLWVGSKLKDASVLFLSLSSTWDYSCCGSSVRGLHAGGERA